MYCQLPVAIITPFTVVSVSPNVTVAVPLLGESVIVKSLVAAL